MDGPYYLTAIATLLGSVRRAVGFASVRTTQRVFRAALTAAVARDAMAGAAADPAELLDVDVHQLAWPLALVAVRRPGRLQP
jgi:hypothetical protein